MRSSSLLVIAYLTDVEGRWDKLEAFCRGNPLVALENGSLRVAEGATFVFGGDAIDRGPASRRIVSALLDAKKRQPSQVVLLAGNRDINKMRLRRELAGHPPSHAPAGLAGPELLRWIFSNTMGAGRAFEHRATELGGADDAGVVASFLADVSPAGPITEYLTHCQLAFRSGETLFLHGALTEESAGVVPGVAPRIEDLDAWIGELNAFFSRQVGAFRDDADERTYSAIIDYQRPLPGTHVNQASVVYGRFTDDSGNPYLPPAAVIAGLERAGVHRLIVGHTPSGDTPSVLRDPEHAFELIMADNSYSRLETGTQLTVDGARVGVRASAELDGGSRAEQEFDLRLDRDSAPIGLRDPSTRQLVKGPIGTGALLLFRGLPEYKTEQIGASLEEISRRSLVVPRRP